MTIAANSKLKGILREYVTPFLREHGFKKRGMLYECDRTSLAWLIDVQRSRWNDATESRFTANCGVYIPGVFSMYANLPEPAKPKVPECACFARIGMLMPERLDVWWTLKRDTSDEANNAIGEAVRDSLRDFALPFLQSLGQPSSVADFLVTAPDYRLSQVDPSSQPQRLAYAAIIYSMQSNESEADRCLARAIELTQGTEFVDNFINLRERI